MILTSRRHGVVRSCYRSTHPPTRLTFPVLQEDGSLLWLYNATISVNGLLHPSRLGRRSRCMMSMTPRLDRLTNGLGAPRVTKPFVIREWRTPTDRAGVTMVPA